MFNKIFKNLLANGAGFVVEAVIAFCMLPYIINRVGEAAYGIWAVILSLSGYMGILNLGLRPAINKYVAQYNALGKKERILELIHCSLVTYFFCAVVIACVSVVVSLRVTHIFNIPHDFQRASSVLVLLVGMQMSTGLIAVVYGGVISGMQRYEINNGIEIFVMLSRTAIILLFLNKYPTIYTIAAAHFSMTMIGYLVTFYAAGKIVDFKNMKIFTKPSKEMMLNILSFSAITFVIGIVGRIMTYIDSLIIGTVLTTTIVTYYAVGSRLIQYLKNLIEVLMNVIAPAISEMSVTNRSEIGDLYIYASKFSSLISYPILSFLIIQGNEFLYLWMGESYPYSYNIMLILSIGGIFVFPQMSTNPILYGLARHKIIMWVSIVEGVVSVILSIGLCRYWNVYGIAVGLVVPKALLGGIIYPIYVCRLLNLSLSKLIWQCYFRSLITVSPIVMLLYWAKEKQVVDTWLFLGGEVVICGVIYSVSVYVLSLDKNERQQLWAIIRNRSINKSALSDVRSQ